MNGKTVAAYRTGNEELSIRQERLDASTISNSCLEPTSANSILERFHREIAAPGEKHTDQPGGPG
jgi:hypothetical protein